MPYSDLTTDDPNPVKRFLQRRRFHTALDLYPKADRSLQVLDFGGGDGELCALLADFDHRAGLFCYEPTTAILEEARQRLADKSRVTLLNSLDLIEPASCDVIFSLEVFEHLPAKETEEALNAIFRFLKPSGVAIFGVPNELFLAALYKGLFRIGRRYGEYDASVSNILKCVSGKPPQDRPVGEISSGWRYHFHHTGFDHRQFKKKLNSRASSVSVSYSPCALLGAIASPEIYFTCAGNAQ